MNRAFLLAIIAGVCMVAINANASISHSVEDVVEAVPFDNDYIDIASSGFLGALFTGLKWTLRSIKGVHCTILAAVDMKNAAETFVQDVQACGGTSSKQVQNLVDSCLSVISTANDIVNLNENVCNDASNSDSTVGDSCFFKLMAKLNTLGAQIANSIYLITQVPKAGVGASVCVVDAVDKLTPVFTGFPQFIVNCSKLVS